MSTETTTSVRGVVVSEPKLPRRSRRPSDLARLVGSLLLLAIPLVLGSVAVSASTGLEQDLLRSFDAIQGLTRLVLRLGVYTSAFLLLAVPVGMGLDLLLRRRVWQLLDALIAATVAIAIASALRWWIVHEEPGRILDVADPRLGHHRGAHAAHPGPADRDRRVPHHGGGRRPPLVAAAGGPVDRGGVAVRLPVRVRHGAVHARVGAAGLVDRAGGPLRARRAEHPADRGRRSPTPWSARASRWCTWSGSSRSPTSRAGTWRELGHAGSGELVRVEVLDRDTYGSALAYRLWRRLRVRGPATRRTFLTVRSAVDHTALMVLAARDAGADVPRLVAVTEIGPSAALIALRNEPGHTLADAVTHGDEVDDDQLRAFWTELERLQARKLVHRGLTSPNMLIPDHGGAVLLDLGGGEIAASDLAMRLDTVQLLVTLALVAGPERAVRTGVEVLGPNPIVDSLPLLQRIALSRDTRRALKQHKGLLHDLRTHIIEVTPADPDVEEIKLERLSGRTVIAIVGGSVAAYVVATQLTQVNFGSLGHLSWTWAAVALVCSCLTYLAAGMTCVGFVTARLSLWRATLVQYAVGFSGLLAPTAVGTVALNVRFLERSGVDPAVAVSSVGLVQLVMFVGHIVLIVLFGVLAGTGAAPSFTPPQGAIVGVLVALVVALIGLSLPWGRRLLQQRVQPLVRRVVPQLIAVFQRPGKLALGIGGAVLLNLAYIAALDASVRAFGHSLSFSAIAIVYLAGSVVGAAVPTPGGLGGIELAMASGLTATGLPAGVAVSAVLLYRIVTFWIPIPIGWVSLTWLQKVGSL